MGYKKKLIEVALPLEAINKQSAREKSIRHGHPSTLHLWWARRPLAAARAVIWASLVDDPSSLPEQFPTEEEQNTERDRLFEILTELTKWENSNNQVVLDAAKAEIMKSTDGNPPALLDPFAGGGAIPLEAQRLGLEAHACDLNPVAVMINKAMIEIPPKFAGQPPVNPDSSHRLDKQWIGAQGLAEDVRYYGQWMKQKAFERIGHLYPKAKDEYGKESTVIAWIWARTVKCPNPVCGCEMPLMKSFIISKKANPQVYIDIEIKQNESSICLTYVVKQGNPSYNKGTVNRKGAMCIACDTPVGFKYIRDESKEGRLSAQMVAIVIEGKRERVYLSPDEQHINAARLSKPIDCDFGDLAYYPGYINPYAYGLTEIKSLFTDRQITTISTFCELFSDVKSKVVDDMLAAEIKIDSVDFNNREESAKTYSEAIMTYLALAIDKLADYNSSICSWHNSKQLIRNTFGLTGMSMSWDYAEANPFSNSSGCFDNAVNWIEKCIKMFPVSRIGSAQQSDAQSDIGLRDIIVSTDPPYYSNVPYAAFSDFFYVLLRQGLKKIYPTLFRTLQTPKAEEIVADPYRAGSKEKASNHFESGMLNACKQMHLYTRMDIPVTIYYSFKQNESETNEDTYASSSGWETMLSAILEAGFSITGTWPIRTEMANRTRANESNALASSIVLVCRKRTENAHITTRRDFINTLKRELKPALLKLQASNIAPVDLAQSAIGPGMSVYSRFAKVLEADGRSMNVRSALQIIIQELYQYFNEQNDELDRDSHFCVALYSEYAFNDIKFGEANQWAQSKNTSVEKLDRCGVLYAQKGVVHLLTRDEITKKIDTEIIWVLTQQLTHAMEKDGVVGVAKIVADIFTSEPEHAKGLAYRLFTIAERKGWAQEAYAYNSLVIAWPDVQAKAAELQSERNNARQISLDGIII